MTVRGVLRRHPDAQRIFRGEDDERKDLDAEEEAAVFGVVARDRFEDDGGDVDEHEHDQEPTDELLALIADRAVVEDLVDAMAPGRVLGCLRGGHQWAVSNRERQLGSFRGARSRANLESRHSW